MDDKGALMVKFSQMHAHHLVSNLTWAASSVRKFVCSFAKVLWFYLGTLVTSITLELTAAIKVRKKKLEKTIKTPLFRSTILDNVVNIGAMRTPSNFASDLSHTMNCHSGI